MTSGDSVAIPSRTAAREPAKLTTSVLPETPANPRDTPASTAPAASPDARSASAMVRSLSGGMPDRERLTDRELDVLRLLARGLSNRAIGAELFISETTVKFHVGNLMRKLMVSRRAEAVYTATKLGLL